MKSLVVDQEKTINICDVTKPNPAQHQALVKIISCGICNGTDLKLVHGTFKGFDDSSYPLMLGHEAVGRVIKTGDQVTGLEVDDIVLLPFNDKTGDYHSAWGAFSEYGIVNDYEAVSKLFPDNHGLVGLAKSQTKLPSWIDPVKAVMIITLREVLSSIKRFGMTKENSIVIYGCGPVGQTFIKFLSLLGVEELFAVDIIDSKLVLAKSNGANYVFNSKKANVSNEIKKIKPEGVDFVLDAVGISAIINQAMSIIRDQGTICCYGISPNTHANIDWSAAPYNWKLHFQQFPSKDEEGSVHNQIIEWLEKGLINLDDFISDIFSLNEIYQAFEKLEKKEIALKGIVVFD